MRPSPTYRAKEYPNEVHDGNDGKKWMSVINKNGIFSWRRCKSCLETVTNLNAVFLQIEKKLNASNLLSRNVTTKMMKFIKEDSILPTLQLNKKSEIFFNKLKYGTFNLKVGPRDFTFSRTGQLVNEKNQNLTYMVFSATAYMLNSESGKRFAIKDIVPAKYYKKTIEEMHAIGNDIMKTSTEIEECVKGIKITWTQDNKMNVKVIFNNESSMEERKEAIKEIIHGFRDGAEDGYLEGDAHIYNDDFEFILDDFTIAGKTQPSYW